MSAGAQAGLKLNKNGNPPPHMVNGKAISEAPEVKRSFCGLQAPCNTLAWLR